MNEDQSSMVRQPKSQNDLLIEYFKGSLQSTGANSSVRVNQRLR
jgi:hypothetical protein